MHVLVSIQLDTLSADLRSSPCALLSSPCPVISSHLWFPSLLHPCFQFRDHWSPAEFPLLDQGEHFLQVVIWASSRLSSLVSLLSGITLLYCCVSSILRVIVSYLLPTFIVLCGRRINLVPATPC